VVTEGDLAFFSSDKQSPSEQGPPPPPPDELVPGGSHSPEYYCKPMPVEKGRPAPPPGSTGVIAFGVVTYKDIFGEPQYRNFCYYNPLLMLPDPASSLPGRGELFPCPIHNDGD